MATTMFFEGELVDKGGKQKNHVHLEFGRSSYYDGESLIYIAINGEWVILDEAQGREIYEAMDNLGGYLGYDRKPR